MTLITEKEVNFEQSLDVISGAQKFIIPVPTLENGGEPLVFPAGAKDKDGNDLTGPITDWQGKPIGEAGVVFRNATDNAYQAVLGNGDGVIIINEVNKEQGKQLLSKINELSSNKPENITLEQIKETLEYAKSIGLSDMYNSDNNFIESKMSAIDSEKSSVKNLGLHKRDDRDICQAIKYTGKVEYQGPAATPQSYENGMVLVKQGDAIRAVEPNTFLRTYTQKNGSPLDIKEIPTKLTKDQVGISALAAAKLR